MQSPQSNMGQFPNQTTHVNKITSSSSRILLDVPCKVCRDHSSGKHYGIFACDGCAGFFKRSIRRNRQYSCKSKSEGACMVDKTHRNQCRACRLTRCLEAGMNKEAVQHGRGPRNSTIRRQMALYYGSKEHEIGVPPVIPPPMHSALNLVLPKSTALETGVSIAPPVFQPTIPIYSTMNYYKYPISTPMILSLPRIPLTVNETICEQAARLLFMNVTWARDLNVNSGLGMDDQLTILEASWRELFLLAAAQCSPDLDPTPLLPIGPQTLALSIEASRFRDTVHSFSNIGLDPSEFSCVRAVVLYKAGLDYDVPSSRSSNGSLSPITPRLKDVATVVRLRDAAQAALGSRLAHLPPGPRAGAARFSKLLMMLPLLRNVSPQAIEEFFFRRTIGNTSIEKIICDIYSKS